METNQPDCMILTEEELAEVTAGRGPLIDNIVRICAKMGISVTPEMVSEQILNGGCSMRNLAKMLSNNNPICNIIPCF